MGNEAVPLTKGAGFIDTMDAYSDDLTNGDYFTVDGAAAGLELLGAVASPLGTLFSAGIGWLIEHVEFLNEGLDVLAGDPEQVEQLAALWGQDVHQQVARAADGYRGALRTDVPSWTGYGAEAYRGAGELVARALEAEAHGATATSHVIRGTATLVATTRGIIRDLIADFVGEVLAKAVLSVAGSLITFGGSVGLFIAWATKKASGYARMIAEYLSKLSDKLALISGKFDNLSKATDDVAKWLNGEWISNTRSYGDQVADYNPYVDSKPLTEWVPSKTLANARDSGVDYVTGKADALPDPVSSRVDSAGDTISEEGLVRTVDDATSIRDPQSDFDYSRESFNPTGTVYTVGHEQTKALSHESENYAEAQQPDDRTGSDTTDADRGGARPRDVPSRV